MALFGSLIDKHRALLRFSGYRWAIALAASAVLTVFACTLFGAPPANFAEWPPDARDAASRLVQGAWRLSLAGWLAVAAAPAVWLPEVWLRWFVRPLVAFAVTGLVASGLHSLIEGLGATLRLPEAATVLGTAARATLVPMAIGSLPLLAEAFHERLGKVAALRRWLSTGVGPSGGWMTGAKLKPYTRPLPNNSL